VGYERARLALISDNYFILHITLSVGLERKEETEDRRKNSNLKIKKTWTAKTLLFISAFKILRTNAPRLNAFNLENLKPNSS
jgi:hypothetical protein